jgi:hypothetical protein
MTLLKPFHRKDKTFHDQRNKVAIFCNISSLPKWDLPTIILEYSFFLHKLLQVVDSKWTNGEDIKKIETSNRNRRETTTDRIR